MHKTKVINLGQIRDLLVEWEKVRDHILSGGMTGFNAAFMDEDGREAIFIGGVYKDDPAKLLRSALKMSQARTMAEDEPPRMQAGSL